jgi:hypothetical protein
MKNSNIKLHCPELQLVCCKINKLEHGADDTNEYQNSPMSGSTMCTNEIYEIAQLIPLSTSAISTQCCDIWVGYHQ